MHSQNAFGKSKKATLSSYDALQDRFASCYFNSQGVKKHLKKLKRALQNQPKYHGYDQYNQKLNKKLIQIQKNQQKQKEKEKSLGRLKIIHKVQPYVKTLKPNSMNKLISYRITNTKFKRQASQVVKKIKSQHSLPYISKQNSPSSRNNKFQKINISLQKKHQNDSKSISKVPIKNSGPSVSLKQGSHTAKSSQSLLAKRTNSIPKRTNYQSNRQNMVKHEDLMNFINKRREQISILSENLSQRKKQQQIVSKV